MCEEQSDAAYLPVLVAGVQVLSNGEPRILVAFFDVVITRLADANYGQQQNADNQIYKG